MYNNVILIYVSPFPIVYKMLNLAAGKSSLHLGLLTQSRSYQPLEFDINVFVITLAAPKNYGWGGSLQPPNLKL